MRLFLLPLLLVATSVWADAIDEIDAMLAEAYGGDGPGAAVIITRGDETLLRKGYGHANIEHGIPIEPQTVFRIGSITKQFTGAAIHLLAEDGKLALDDPIQKFLPEYPTHGHEITVDHLLTHTSGIFSYTSLPGFMASGARLDVDMKGLIGQFKNEPMDFAPGEKFAYNNSAYVLLGAIIETLSGQTYAEFLQQRIFDPLGMANSYYGGHQLIPKRAAGYQKNGDLLANAGYISMTQPHAAGALLSTVDDLAKWNRALHGGKLLRADSYARMTRKFALNDGSLVDYGHGLFVADRDGVAVLEHGGGIHGFACGGNYVPSTKTLVAVLTNCIGCGDPNQLTRRITALLHEN